MEQTSTQQQTQTLYHTREDCRLCNSKQLTLVWNFGETPLANNYLAADQLESIEPIAPLTVAYCPDCHLVQLRDVVDPDVLFSHYLYVSSTSPSFVKHFEDYAQQLIKRFQLTSNDLVVDVGSNDGVLLKPLKAAGVKTLGIDPAENVAALANAAGIETLAAFFTPETARYVASARGQAKIITANNVFAHTDDIMSFAQAVKELLAPDGAYVFEVQYLGDLIKDNLFDIVYHEHTCYYHVTPLVRLMNHVGLEIFDVQHQPVHGGSLRVFVQHHGGPHPRQASVGAYLARETMNGLNDPNIYQRFNARIQDNKTKLHDIIADIKKQGKTIAGYGAPAKATTLMYAFGLDSRHLDFIVDDAPLKQGRHMPGTHIPIVSPDMLYTKQPDYCLILAWNFAEPIMSNHQKFTEKGGKFIVPVPEPRVV